MTDDRWRDRAACRGMDINLFFPPPGDRPTEARRVCARCPVAEECLSFVMTLPHNDTYGVWAGTTQGNRRYARHRASIKLREEDVA